MSQITRRTLLGGALAGTTGALMLGFESPASAADVLPEFPEGIRVQRARFRNWDGAIVADSVWTSVPTSEADVLAIANWAVGAGYTIRATGYRHTWSPLTVESGTPASATVLLVDTTAQLTAMRIPEPGRVEVQAGARMDTLLQYLHEHGASLPGTPAPGNVTVGGVLAVNGHGTGVRAVGEERVPGQSVGTMSNAVTALTAVVWDADSQTYVARTFDRAHPDAKAFLTGLGRTFLLSVTLQTVADYTLRCRNTTAIPASTLFAAPESAGPQSLASLIDQHGRVGIIWFTYTSFPWVQTWTLAPRRPLGSRPTVGPYNFPFADNLPQTVTTIVGRIGTGIDSAAPALGAAVLSATTAGLIGTLARDMWGPAKDFLHFVRPTTLRVSAGSHAVVTRRSEVQRVVHAFSTWFTAALARYRARGQYPVNSCVEIRVTGIDNPAEVDVPGAEAPALSAARPVDDKPEYDTVVWLDALTLPGTPHEFTFFAEMEAFIAAEYAAYAVVRPEWSKRWATTASGSWTDLAAMQRIPSTFPEWSWAVETFERYDPARIFTNPLLDRLMPPT